MFTLCGLYTRTCTFKTTLCLCNSLLYQKLTMGYPTFFGWNIYVIIFVRIILFLCSFFLGNQQYVLTEIAVHFETVSTYTGCVQEAGICQISRALYIRFWFIFCCYDGTLATNRCCHCQPFCIFCLFLTDIEVRRVSMFLWIF